VKNIFAQSDSSKWEGAMSMDDYAYMRRKRHLEMPDKEMSEARKNAIQNMIYFRNDNPLYIFWRNVYQYYRNTADQSKEIFQTQKEQAL
jgi:hypothetical protein